MSAAWSWAEHVLPCCSGDQVFVVKLRLHGTILSGLVRALPQRIPPKAWAAIVGDIAGLAKRLSKPLPEVLDRFTDTVTSWDGVDQGLGVVESASKALVQVLNDMQGVNEGRGEPLRIVLDAMMKELGAGRWYPVESMCCSAIRTGEMTRSLRAVTVVIDEANIAFNVEPDTERGVIQETKAALQFFTDFTKEERKVGWSMHQAHVEHPDPPCLIAQCDLSASTGQRDLGVIRACLPVRPDKERDQFQPRQLHGLPLRCVCQCGALRVCEQGRFRLIWG